MASFDYQGQRVDVVENWRIGEQIEAENALDLDLETAKSAAKTALVIFMSIRRVDKSTPVGALADQVLMMDLTELADTDEEPGEDEAGPPAPEPEEGAEDAGENGDSGIDAQRITGHLRSASSA